MCTCCSHLLVNPGRLEFLYSAISQVRRFFHAHADTEPQQPFSTFESVEIPFVAQPVTGTADHFGRLDIFMSCALATSQQVIGQPHLQQHQDY